MLLTVDQESGSGMLRNISGMFSRQWTAGCVGGHGEDTTGEEGEEGKGERGGGGGGRRGGLIIMSTDGSVIQFGSAVLSTLTPCEVALCEAAVLVCEGGWYVKDSTDMSPELVASSVC